MIILPRAMDSLEFVEAIMLIEEIFGADIPVTSVEDFGSPREIVDWLELHLSNQRPNDHAISLLRKLAKERNSPGLTDGLGGMWRREQIAAIIHKIFSR